MSSFLDRPAGSPPSGQISNLDDPPNLLLVGRAILLLTWFLSSIPVFIRLYTKIFIVREFRFSDCMYLGLGMGYLATGWLINEAAPGVDQWNLRLRDFIRMLYRDLFFWSCHSLVWLNFIFYTICTFLEIFACRPLSKAWDVLNTDGSCLVNTRLINIISSAFNSVSDLMLLLLPQTRIWRLHVKLRKRVFVSAVFLFGVLATTSSIIRLVYTVLLYTTTNNLSYYSWMAGVWTLPEIACGIIAGCLPSLARFFRHLARSTFLAELRSFPYNLIRYSSHPSRRRPDGDGEETTAQVNKTRGVPDRFLLASFASARAAACPATQAG
ncbi:uncharacterized protein BO97DRAFT_433014 [Aspergillus homomorphus CBS 101889]|uniref:Rhodopsin domain-containing protein n=1 Tax=Aspergillus homomorphus (strain CBS 101889) TaxID=1450537 RepID=A0A395I580_ASPHC|nr:hypothetical protein BO97DRAFT_433014 [Aspergillus homomorphus CBS 101889]RAL14348.1 hypothetical protein BO97DRAFT_433014 [Aspergillus homomorphus CBS 101889]